MTRPREKPTPDESATTSAVTEESGVTDTTESSISQESSLPNATEAFVALSQFVIANGMMEEVKQAFRTRPHLVDGAPGFVRMEVMVPRDNPEQIWLVTYWTDEESYRVWHHGHLYRESHKGIPKGLKLVPGSAKVRLFDFVCS